MFLIINSENQTKRSNSLTGVWNLSETSIIVMVINILLYYIKIITVITVLSSTKIIQFLVHFFWPSLPFCVLMFDYIYLDLIFSEIRETTILFIENPRRYNNFYNNIFIWPLLTHSVIFLFLIMMIYFRCNFNHKAILQIKFK